MRGGLVSLVLVSLERLEAVLGPAQQVTEVELAATRFRIGLGSLDRTCETRSLQ